MRNKLIVLVLVFLLASSMIVYGFASLPRQPIDTNYNVNFGDFHVTAQLRENNDGDKPPEGDYVWVGSSDGIKMEFTDIQWNSRSNQWDLTFTIEGDFYVGKRNGYDRHESVEGSIYINSRKIYPDGDLGDQYGKDEDSLYYRFAGKSRTMSVPYDPDEPMKLEIKVLGYGNHKSSYNNYYAFKASLREERIKTINLNKIPVNRSSVDRNYINGNDSSSITVSGKAYDPDGDSFTVKATMDGHTKSQSFGSNSFVSQPNQDNFSFTFTESELTDGTHQLIVNVIDNYGDVAKRTFTVYVDYKKPKISVDNLVVLLPNDTLSATVDDYCKIYLLKNDVEYNTHFDVTEAITNGKGKYLNGLSNGSGYLDIGDDLNG